ncbi:hypothetical protein AB0D49_34750 [Streptomyces sp. NPDC048290]|uniref:hypothetical protein n=1 Tax=Streptomyces sp. NPDC048290 TaxID=3155811 RepID=UPI00341D19C1
MVITRRTTRGLLCAAVAASLAFTVTGCSSDEGTEEEPLVKAQQLCGGTAISPAAAEALHVIMGVDQFEASDDDYTIPLAAENLRLTGRTEGTGTEDICRIFTPLKALTTPLRVRYWLTETTANKDENLYPQFTKLSMGDLSGTSPDTAFISFDCHDNNSPLTSVPYHIEVFVETTGAPVEPEGDLKEIEDAFATLTHSFALAMAKELRCTDNGGLDAQPSLNPV